MQTELPSISPMLLSRAKDEECDSGWRTLLPCPGRQERVQPTSVSEGAALLLCKSDLEGIVAKKKDASYFSNERHSAWVKIKNPRYS